MAETLSERIIRTWKASPELRSEFMNDITSYEAFCRADTAGLVRIIGKNKAE